MDEKNDRANFEERRADESLSNTMPNATKQGGKTYFYISVVACVLSAVALVLAFTVLGVYSLIASVLLELTALSFAATQKKKFNFPLLKAATITAYVLLAVSVLVFIGGIIYASSLK